MSTTPKEEKAFNYTPYLWAAGIIGVGGIIAPAIITSYSTFVVFDGTTGVIGDTIGGITAPFFNLVGSILVYIALRAQIDANRQVSDQFEKQEIGNIKRDFENTFFQMLQIHHQIVDNMDFELGKLKVTLALRASKNFPWEKELSELILKEYGGSARELNTSRDIFKGTYMVLKRILSIIFDFNDSKNDKRQDIDILKETYLIVYEILNSDLGHYFRNLYRIIKLIDEQDFKIDDPKKEFELRYHYTSIVRAQLSDYEVLWLFYNGLYDYGKKFKPLMEDYALLKILDGNEDEVFMKFENEYKRSAYEKTYPGK